MAYSMICDLAGALLPTTVRRDADGASVPTDAETADSLAYREWLSVGNTPTPLPTPTLAEARSKTLAALGERRWRAETAGTVVNGLSLATDERTQSKLTAAVVASVLDNDYSVNWKLADGSFRLFDHAEL